MGGRRLHLTEARGASPAPAPPSKARLPWEGFAPGGHRAISVTQRAAMPVPSGPVPVLGPFSQGPGADGCQPHRRSALSSVVLQVGPLTVDVVQMQIWVGPLQTC